LVQQNPLGDLSLSAGHLVTALQRIFLSPVGEVFMSRGERLASGHRKKTDTPHFPHPSALLTVG
jgi:hypothetical protein